MLFRSHVSCANIYREDRCLQLLQCTSPTRILCQYLQRGQVSTASPVHQPNTYPVPISTEDRCLQLLQWNIPTRILCQHLQRGQVSTAATMHHPNTYPVPISTERTGIYNFLYWILPATREKEFRPLIFKGWNCGS